MIARVRRCFGCERENEYVATETEKFQLKYQILTKGSYVQVVYSLDDTSDVCQRFINEGYGYAEKGMLNHSARIPSGTPCVCTIVPFDEYVEVTPKNGTVLRYNDLQRLPFMTQKVKLLAPAGGDYIFHLCLKCEDGQVHEYVFESTLGDQDLYEAGAFQRPRPNHEYDVVYEVSGSSNYPAQRKLPLRPREPNVQSLLAKQGVEKYWPILEKADIKTATQFSLLDQDKLREIGVCVTGDIIRIMRAVENVKNAYVNLNCKSDSKDGDNIKKILQKVGFSNLYFFFEKEKISDDMLGDLDDEILKNIGIKNYEARKSIMREIKEMPDYVLYRKTDDDNIYEEL